MLGPPAYTAVWVLIPNITFPDHPLVNPLPAWGLKPLNREQFDLKPSLAAKGWGEDHPEKSRVLPGANTVIKTGPSLFLRTFLEHREQGLIATCLSGLWIGATEPAGKGQTQSCTHTPALPATVRESLPAGSRVVGRPLPWAVSLEVDDLPVSN